MKIALGMTTDKLTILGKSYIALNNSGTLDDRGGVRFESVFGVLQTCPTVTDREVFLFISLQVGGTRLKFCLQGGIILKKVKGKIKSRLVNEDTLSMNRHE